LNVFGWQKYSIISLNTNSNPFFIALISPQSLHGASPISIAEFQIASEV